MTLDEIRSELEPLIRERGVRETARLAGVQHCAIVNWLAGRSGLGVDTLERVARAVGRELRLGRAR